MHPGHRNIHKYMYILFLTNKMEYISNTVDLFILTSGPDGGLESLWCIFVRPVSEAHMNNVPLVMKDLIEEEYMFLTLKSYVLS